MNGPNHNAWGQFFVIGIGAALIVAGSVVVMLRVIRSSPPPHTGTAANTRAPTTAAIDHARPWAAVVLSAFGALLAAFPLMVAFGILLGNALMRNGPSAYVIGAAVAGVGVAGLRSSRSLFLEQLAAIALTTGMGLLIYALFRDLPTGAASFILSAAAFTMAATIGKPWLGGILGVIATTALAFAVTQSLGVRAYPGTSAYFVTWSVMAAAWVAATLALDGNRSWLEPLPAAPSLDAIAAGGGVAVLGALSVASGTTFLFDGMLGTGMTRVHAGSTASAMWPLAMWFTPQRGLGLAFAAAACAALARMYPAVRSPVGIACVATALLLAIVMPRLGPVVLILAIAATTGRRNLAVLAAAAVLWIVGNFYYALALSLTEKAAILAAAGGVLGAIAFAIRTPTVAPTKTASLGAVPFLTRVLAAGGLVLAGGISAQAIYSKEALIRDGRSVFVELAPVDPRSLMQGDYMALRFRIPDDALRHLPMTGPRPMAIGTIDTGGVAKLTRIGTLRDPIGRDEIRIELTPARRSWTIVTNAWFFKEGNAKRWEAARYGEFRVLPDGRALLVALADKDRVVIKP